MQGIPLRGIVLEEKGQKTRQEVVIFVESSECNYESTKTKENQEQSFVFRERLRNIWCENCLEVWKWRNNEVGSKVKYTKYKRKDTIVEKKYQRRKEEIFDVQSIGQEKSNHSRTRRWQCTLNREKYSRVTHRQRL